MPQGCSIGVGSEGNCGWGVPGAHGKSVLHIAEDGQGLSTLCWQPGMISSHQVPSEGPKRKWGLGLAGALPPPPRVSSHLPP